MSTSLSQLGQRFILGFQGPTLPEWLVEFSERFGLGGVILFDYCLQSKSFDNNIHNPEQVRTLISGIKGLPGRPKIYVDQEGGKVRRFKEYKGFQALVSHQEYAKMEKLDRMNHLQRALAELKSLGVDVVLGPVIDVNYNPLSPDIGVYHRSFSGNINLVAECAHEWFEIARSCDLELCIKHYPGLGAAHQNSHHKLTNLSNCFHQEQEELFYQLLPNVPGSNILISHGVVDQWGKGLPLSVNPVAYRKIQERFSKANIITDDMQMRGLLDLMPLKEACFKALECGVGHICIGNNLMNQENEMLGLIEELGQAL